MLARGPIDRHPLAVRAPFRRLLWLSFLPAAGIALAPWLAVRHWLVDLPACFVVQATAWLLLQTLILLLCKQFRFAALAGATALVGLGAVLPGWWAAGSAHRGEGVPLRVLSLNLLRGNEAGSPAALATIRELAPDVVFGSEVTPAWLAALNQGLGDYPHHLAAADPGYFGLALWSKVPVRELAVLPLGVDWAPALRVVLETTAGPVGLLGVHTPRPGMGERCTERDRALAAIPAALAPLPARRVVVGDCNATPWNAGFRELLATTGMVDAAGDGFRPTWPTMWPWPLRVPIDHVLVGGGIGVTPGSAQCGPEFGSDHAPLFVELRL